MNNRQIHTILTSNALTRNCFEGVYALEEIKGKVIKNNSGIIVNLSKSTEPGTHWVSIFKPFKGPTEYFDSFALGPWIKQEIIDFLPELFLYNGKRLQSEISTACGQYCIYFIFKRARGYSMREILSEFDTSSHLQNDFKVNHKVENIFEIDLTTVDPEYISSQSVQQPIIFMKQFHPVKDVT